MEAAVAEQVTGSSILISSSSNASITSSSVMILVTEAMASFSWEFFSNSTLPLDSSISTADFPPISSAVPSAGTVSAAIHP